MTACSRAWVAATLVTATVAAPSRAVCDDQRRPTRASSIIALMGERWSKEERSTVEALLARLPPSVVAQLPRVVARGDVTCASDGWPDDDAVLDERGVVHICEPPRGSTALIVGRDVVTALLFGLDRFVGWSEDPAWRRLNDWSASVATGFRPRAENQDVRSFAVPRGQRSPRWDLVTFMTALFVDPPTDDGGIGCRHMSQAAFVRGRLDQASGTPTRTAPGCPAFERWADLDHLVAVEVVLAAPSTAMIGSLFGHLFLRLVYRDEAGETPLHLSNTVAFLADNETPAAEESLYALKGIFGFYTASLHERRFPDAYREYVVAEGRDLRRWRLNLLPAERASLLERLWTVAGGGRYSYYFFRRNCATLMLDLVDGIRSSGGPVTTPGLLAAPPASTLEGWEKASGSDGQPLLEFVPEPILSFDHLARLAARQRAEVESRILAMSAGPAADAIAAAFRGAHEGAPEIRAAAYARLAGILCDAHAGEPADVYAWLRASVAIESHLSTLTNRRAEERADGQRRLRVRLGAEAVAAQVRTDAGMLAARRSADTGLRLAYAVQQVTASDRALRLEGYLALRDLTAALPEAPEVVGRIRLLGLLQSEARYDVGLMKKVPGLRDALLFVDPEKPIDRQTYVSGYEELVRLPVETHVSSPLRQLQKTKQVLFVARALDQGRAPVPADDEESTAARLEYATSLSRSGIDQTAVSGALSRGSGSVPLRAGLVLAGALYDEQLGDHRRFGFPSDTALVVARSAAMLTIAGSAPVIAAYDARVFGYRSLRPPLPESGTGRWPLGWEAFVDLRGSRSLALAAEVRVGWGVLAPVLTRDELANHLLVGLGLTYEGSFPTARAAVAERPQGLAIPVALELRAGLGTETRYRSWGAARVWAEPVAVLVGARARLATKAGGTAEAHWALRKHAKGGAHDPALLVRADLLRTTLTFTRVAVATEALLSVGVELR